LGTDNRNFIANKTHFHSNQNVISIWTQSKNNNDDSLENAGNYIGILERLFVFLLTDSTFRSHWLIGHKIHLPFGDLKEARTEN
jgi:hypothetical protein